MSDEIREVEAMEGRPANRPGKPIIEMTEEELIAWVQTMRDCLTQHQSLVAEAKVSKVERQRKEDEQGLDMFE